MAIYSLSSDLIFPDPRDADPEGLLAFGGDLDPERVLLAYQSGIFPWYSDDQPLLWWSPDPRLIMLPEEFHISKTLRRTLRSGKFEVRADTVFEDVIAHCAGIKRRHEEGTWITNDMIRTYTELHRAGYAHSVEVFEEGKLVGGLYGISLGQAFFGESMFSHARDASKVAFAALANVVEKWGFKLIDCQLPTDHLKRLGAFEIPREQFLTTLRRVVARPTKQKPWTEDVAATLQGIVY